MKIIKENEDNVQCVILCIQNTDSQTEYGNGIVNKLNNAGISAIVDYSKKTLSDKIRIHTLPKLKAKPYCVILGDKEVADKTITVRDNQTAINMTTTIDDFIKHLNEAKLIFLTI